MTTREEGPIKPDDSRLDKDFSIPPGVIEVFNLLIIERWNGQSAIVSQQEVMNNIIIKTGEKPYSIIQKGWLDVEDIYRKVGWVVKYDKPGYNEGYESYYEFTRGPK